MRIFAAIAILLVLCFLFVGLVTRDETVPTLNITGIIVDDINKPGGMKFVIETVDPYATKTCWTRTASGDLTVALNAAGEAYFGEWADDVNTEIAAAMTAANASAESANGNTFCEDQCPGAAGSGSHNNGGTTSADSVSASVNWTTQSYDVGDPICDPDSTAPGPVSPHIQIVVSAPGFEGVDLRTLIASLDLSKLSTTDFNSDQRDAFAATVAALLAESSLIVGVDDGGSYKRAIFTLPGVGGEFSVQHTPSVPSVFVNLKTWVNTPPLGYISFDTSADYSTITGDMDAGDTLDFSGKSETPTSNISPGVFPSSASIEVGDGSPREIDETIPLEPSGDSFVPGADSAHVTASGSSTVALTDEHTVVITPHAPCRIHWTYVNVRPWQGDVGCYNTVEILKDALHRDAPKLKAPACITFKNKAAAA